MRIEFQAKLPDGKTPERSIKHPTANQFVAKVAQFIERHSPTHVVTLEPPKHTSVLALEDLLSNWLIAVNRSYLGRHWHTEALKYRGMVVLSEIVAQGRSDVRSVYLLVRPPIDCQPDEFAIRGKSLFHKDSDSPPLTHPDINFSSVRFWGDSPLRIAESFFSKVKNGRF